METNENLNEDNGSSSRPRGRPRRGNVEVLVPENNFILNSDTLTSIISNAVSAAMTHMPPTPTDSQNSSKNLNNNNSHQLGQNAKINVTPLDFSEDSFHTWKEHVKLYLMGTGMWGLIDGTREHPGVDLPNLMLWLVLA